MIKIGKTKLANRYSYQKLYFSDFALEKLCAIMLHVKVEDFS